MGMVRLFMKISQNIVEIGKTMLKKVKASTHGQMAEFIKVNGQIINLLKDTESMVNQVVSNKKERTA